MGLETTYEIRTIVAGKITNRAFVNSPQELYAEFRSIGPSVKTYIFKMLKDEDGKLVSSNKLKCNIHNNSFIVKTIYDKTKRIPKDSERPTFIPRDTDRHEEVYDIALFQPLPTLKRVLPIPSLSPTSSGRLVKFSGKTETDPSARSISSAPIGETPSRLSSNMPRGNNASRVSPNIKPTGVSVSTTSTQARANKHSSHRVGDSSTRASRNTNPKPNSRGPANSSRTGSSSRIDKSRRRG